MRKGKMVAQGSHASMASILHNMRNGQSHEDYVPDIVDGEYTMTLKVKVDSDLDQWLRGCFKKIAVSVDSEQELLNIYKQAEDAGLSCSLIKDNGLTEFGGIPTYTAVSIGPANATDIDKITGHLKLL